MEIFNGDGGAQILVPIEDLPHYTPFPGDWSEKKVHMVDWYQKNVLGTSSEDGSVSGGFS